MLLRWTPPRGSAGTRGKTEKTFSTSKIIQKKISSELFRLRAAWDDTVEQLDTVRRENKNLAEEIKDLLDQLGEGGRSIHELDKQRRRLQVKKLLCIARFAVRQEGRY